MQGNPPTETENQTKEYARILRSHSFVRRMWGWSWVCLGGLIVVLLAIGNENLDDRFDPLKAITLVVAITTQLFAAAVAYFRCPRCSERFYIKGKTASFYTAKQCLHCGLRRCD